MLRIADVQRRLTQLHLRAPQKSPRCPRAVCKRFGWCVPPPDRDEGNLPRCRFERYEAWEERLPAAAEAHVSLYRPHKRVWKLLLEEFREEGIELPFEDDPKPFRSRRRRIRI